MNKKEIIKKLKELFSTASEEKTFKDFKLPDGRILKMEDLAEGVNVTEEGETAVENGTYQLNDETNVEIVDGKIVNIIPIVAEEEEIEAEEPQGEAHPEDPQEVEEPQAELEENVSELAEVFQNFNSTLAELRTENTKLREELDTLKGEFKSFKGEPSAKSVEETFKATDKLSREDKLKFFGAKA